MTKINTDPVKLMKFNYIMINTDPVNPLGFSRFLRFLGLPVLAPTDVNCFRNTNTNFRKVGSRPTTNILDIGVTVCDQRFERLHGNHRRCTGVFSRNASDPDQNFNVQIRRGTSVLFVDSPIRDNDGKMSLWSQDDSDPDQNFDRLPKNHGGVLLRHRSAGKCLNSYRSTRSTEVVFVSWACDRSDSDQNFDLTFLENSFVQIRRDNSLCVDRHIRDNGKKVLLMTCAPNNSNQRWLSGSGLPSRPPQIPSPFGHVAFCFKTDGNLVIYCANQPLPETAKWIKCFAIQLIASLTNILSKKASSLGYGLSFFSSIKDSLISQAMFFKKKSNFPDCYKLTVLRSLNPCEYLPIYLATV